MAFGCGVADTVAVGGATEAAAVETTPKLGEEESKGPSSAHSIAGEFAAGQAWRYAVHKYAGLQDQDVVSGPA